MLTSLARANSFLGLSPSRPPEREDEDEDENARGGEGDELEGTLVKNECLFTVMPRPSNRGFSAVCNLRSGVIFFFFFFASLLLWLEREKITPLPVRDIKG